MNFFPVTWRLHFVLHGQTGGVVEDDVKCVGVVDKAVAIVQAGCVQSDQWHLRFG